MIAPTTDAVMPGSDPFAAVASPVLTPPSAEGLSLEQLENMLSDLRYQPRWREESDRAAEYYDGNQLEGERLARMTQLGIPPLVTNLIRPTIDSVLGLESKARTDWRVIEEDAGSPVPDMILAALNQKLSEAERETRADRAISDAHAGQIKTGVGWVEVARSTDAMGQPYRVESVHRGEIFWDWRAKKPDLTDARYLIRKRRFDQDELVAMMPEHADVITKAVSGGFKTWQWDTKDLYDPTLTYAAEVERVTNLEDDEWRDGERKRATLFEVWYRKWNRGLVMCLPTGKVVPFRESDPRHAMAVQAGIITPYEGTWSEVRVAFYLGPHQLYDFKSPYPHRYFPYVPFWGFKEDKSGIPYGLIRGMMSPQDVVNSADAKMHWQLNARRLIATSDAIDTRHNSWQQVQDELSRPDSVVLLDPNKPNATFKVEQDFNLTTQQYQRRMQAANDIENAGGIYKAMLGKESNAVSGTAINSLVEQGSITLAEIRDNYNFSRRQVGEMLYAMVHEDLVGQTATFNVPQSAGSHREVQVTLNAPREDGGVDNNVALVNAKVVLSDVPSTPAFRAQQLMVLSEVVKSLPPEMQMATVDVMFKLSDVPDKDMLIERLRRIAGIQDVPQEQEDAMLAEQKAISDKAMAMQEKAALATIAEKEAKAENLRAETATALQDLKRAAVELQILIDDRKTAASPEIAALQAQLNEVVNDAMSAQLQVQEDLTSAKADAVRQLHDMQARVDQVLQDRSTEKYRVDVQAETDRIRIARDYEAKLAEISRPIGSDEAEAP